MSSRELPVVVVDQCRDVVGTLAQRRDRDPHDADAVVEVPSETALLHFLLQVAVGRGHEPHVDGARLALPKACDGALLQSTQQIGLQVERHLADLVEAERAAVGVFEPAGPSFAGRTREGSGRVAEQLTPEQILRDRTTVEGDEGLVPRGRADRVSEPSEEFLTDASLAFEQDGRASARGPNDTVDSLQDRLAGADDPCSGGGDEWRLDGVHREG